MTYEAADGRGFTAVRRKVAGGGGGGRRDAANGYANSFLRFLISSRLAWYLSVPWQPFVAPGVFVLRFLYRRSSAQKVVELVAFLLSTGNETNQPSWAPHCYSMAKQDHIPFLL